MPVILRYAKISRLQIISQGESYLSILKLQIAEALETYSIWSISHLFIRFFSIPNLITLDSQDMPDLMCMHTILFNIFSKYALCNNYVTPINLSLIVSLNSIIRRFTKIFLIINWEHKILRILIIVWHLLWEPDCHLHNYLIISVIVLLAPSFVSTSWIIDSTNQESTSSNHLP
jgi:hypothetical protein